MCNSMSSVVIYTKLISINSKIIHIYMQVSVQIKVSLHISMQVSVQIKLSQHIYMQVSVQIKVSLHIYMKVSVQIKVSLHIYMQVSVQIKVSLNLILLKKAVMSFKSHGVLNMVILTTDMFLLPTIFLWLCSWSVLKFMSHKSTGGCKRLKTHPHKVKFWWLSLLALLLYWVWLSSVGV